MDNQHVDRPPRVAAVILNYNGWQDTILSLESALESDYANFQIIVIDNGSKNDSFEKLLQWAGGKLDMGDLPPEHIKRLSGKTTSRPIRHACATPGDGVGDGDMEAIFVRGKDNLGYSGGCNLGISAALQGGAEYVFLLNNDARVEKGTISALVEIALERDAAITGARIMDESGEEELFSGSVWPAMLFGIRKTEPDMAEKSWPASRPDGCAFLARRDFLERRLSECGHYFDPLFFMYCEDADLGIYCVSRGYRCEIARDAVVYHGLAKSSGGGGSPLSFYYITRNRIFLANRWLPLYMKVLFHLYYMPSRLVIQALRGIIGRGGAGAFFAVMSGLADGYRGAGGKWKKQA